MSSDLCAAVSVSAVIVSHDGERFLPRLLDAVAASTVPPTELVAVDSDSSDGSRALLVERLGESAVVDAPRDAGFGAAVSRGLSDPYRTASEAPAWIWLLHDDCAPDVDTLRELLAVATSGDRIAVVGPRICAWPCAQRLLEVGVTISGTGHRETRLEPGEYDQGQHEQLTFSLSARRECAYAVTSGTGSVAWIPDCRCSATTSTSGGEWRRPESVEDRSSGCRARAMTSDRQDQQGCGVAQASVEFSIRR